MDRSEIDSIKSHLAEKTIRGDRCLVCGNVNFAEGTVKFRRDTGSMKRTEEAYVRTCRGCGHMQFFAAQAARG